MVRWPQPWVVDCVADNVEVQSIGPRLRCKVELAGETGTRNHARLPVAATRSERWLLIRTRFSARR
jgi:hypothetical protein